MKKLLITALLSTKLFAQSAYVIALTPEETNQEISIVERRKALDNEEFLLKLSIKYKYLVTGSHEWREGWESRSFIFSTDYKFIVPNQTPDKAPLKGTFDRSHQFCLN